MSESKSGYIAIVGRPNVGKSTLLNHLLEQKISITSRKPQTTRNNVLGIKTVGNIQMLFVDTPGIHKGHKKVMNKYMNKAASAALKDVDVVIFVVDKKQWTEEDDWVEQQVSRCDCPVILVVNKVDQIDDKSSLLPHLQVLEKRLPKAELVPISALKKQNLDKLEALVIDNLPKGDHLFPGDQVTDKSARFLAAEIVREKITRQLGEEVPYQSAVEIEEFIEEGRLTTISAAILVERAGQKKMLIGEKGERIKLIGQQARLDMEKLFDCKVMLNLWVKVKRGWSDDERALRSLGFDEN